MPYSPDLTWAFWNEKCGGNSRLILNTTLSVKNTYDEWQRFRAGRSNAQIAIALNRLAHSGTAQAGAASTITLAADASTTDDEYNNLVIRITGGTGAGQERTGSDYAGSTKVLTVSVAWTTNPDATSTYAIADASVAEMDAAFAVGSEQDDFVNNTAVSTADRAYSLRQFSPG